MLQASKLCHILARAGRTYRRTIQMDCTTTGLYGILSEFRGGPAKRGRASGKCCKKAWKFPHLPLRRLVSEASGTHHEVDSFANLCKTNLSAIFYNSMSCSFFVGHIMRTNHQSSLFLKPSRGMMFSSKLAKLYSHD